VAVGDGGRKFDHVASVMFGNRSFDNLLGHLDEPGIAGLREGKHDHGTDQLQRPSAPAWLSMRGSPGIRYPPS
jgi:hypothetical protein